jgi:hypothetical protein
MTIRLFGGFERAFVVCCFVYRHDEDGDKRDVNVYVRTASFGTAILIHSEE